MSKNRHILRILFKLPQKETVIDLLQENEEDLIDKLSELLIMYEELPNNLSLVTTESTVPYTILAVNSSSAGFTKFTDQYLLQLLDLREILIDRWTLKDVINLRRSKEFSYNISHCIANIQEALSKNIKVYKPYSQQTAAEKAELAAELKHFIITRMSQGAIKETIQQLENEGLAQPGTARRVRTYYKEYYATGTEPALKLDKIIDEGLNTDRMFMDHQPIYMDFMGYEMININNDLYEPFIGAYYVKEI